MGVIFWLTGGFMTAAFLFPLLTPRHPELCQRLYGGWFRGLASILKLEIHLHGHPLRTPCLWVANHVSWLDVVVLGEIAPVRFVAKKEVARWPILGFLVSRGGTIFVNRRGSHGLFDTLHAIEKVLRQGTSVAFFPEGTSTPGNTVLPFRPALLQSALHCHVLTQPISVLYHPATLPAIAFVGDDTLVKSLLRTLNQPKIPVHLHFHPPLAPASRHTLARHARQAIVSSYEAKTQNFA